MSFLVDENHANANFATHVWRDDSDDDGMNSAYSTESEAKEAFDRLESGGQFKYGGLYKWHSGTNNWHCLDAWPEDFDGFGV